MIEARNSADILHTKRALLVKGVGLGSVGIAVITALALGSFQLAGGIIVLGLFFGSLFLSKVSLSEDLLLFMALGYATFIGAFFMAFQGIPIGMAMDGALLVGVLGLLYRNYRKNISGYFSIPAGIVVLLWIGLHLVQIANPYAPSRLAWFYVMRPAVAYPFLFFIAYHYVNSEKRMWKILWTLFALIVISALWGLIQHIFGYFSFEYRFLQAADALRLVYIQGRYRIFGPMTSPAQYGVVMAIFGVIFLVLFVGLKRNIRWLFLALFVLTFFTVLYSGTRSAIVVYPIGFGTFVLVSKSWKFLGLGAVLMMGFVVLLFLPINNYHIQRMQSSFKTEEDASFQVREENRKNILPFILSHPVGGGLGSTGVWGMRFSPWHPLAQFAPDSGYLRIAVEMGWVGIIGFLSLLFTMLFYGVKTVWHFDTIGQSHSEIRIVALSLVSALSSLLVVEWVQDIVGKIPFNVFFWVLCGILLKLSHLEQHPKDLSKITS